MKKIRKIRILDLWFSVTTNESSYQARHFLQQAIMVSYNNLPWVSLATFLYHMPIILNTVSEMLS